RRDLLVRRRGDEQLHLEPPLDVPRPAGPLRLAGPALPRCGALRIRRQPDPAERPDRLRCRQGRVTGDCDRAGDSAELRGQQAVVVSRAAAVLVVALALPALAAAGTPKKLAPTAQPPEPRLAKIEVTRIFLGH